MAKWLRWSTYRLTVLGREAAKKHMVLEIHAAHLYQKWLENDLTFLIFPAMLTGLWLRPTTLKKSE